MLYQKAIHHFFGYFGAVIPILSSHIFEVFD